VIPTATSLSSPSDQVLPAPREISCTSSQPRKPPRRSASSPGCALAQADGLVKRTWVPLLGPKQIRPRTEAA
jgi:hypothetical protein